jgi:DNA-binding CsgD family transcriptional regulator
LSFESDSVEGRHRLAQSLDLALIDDAHEHAARAYCNLASVAVTNYRLHDADQHLRAGIAYCDERDLDSWGRYMKAWLAVSLSKQGEYAQAERLATQLLAIPHLAAVTRIHALVVAAELRARRGGDATAPLGRASELAVPTGELQRIFPVATARAETAWLTGRCDDIVAEIDVAWPSATAHPNPWTLGELSWWLWLGGCERAVPVPIAAPFRLMLEGRWHPAADAWTKLGCPLWAAIALGFAPDLDAARRALQIVDGLGASAVREVILRERRIRSLPSPRQPRAATRGNPGGLTARELDVLELLADGLSNAQIAASLVVSPKTVDHHVSAVLRKLGQPGRHRAVEIARREGILPVPSGGRGQVEFSRPRKAAGV